MLPSRATKVLVLLPALLLPACSEPQSMAEAIKELQAREEHGARRVDVQHCLISFAGTRTKQKRRSKSDAEKLADKLFREAAGGADFDTMVKDFTDDSPPGIYKMVTGDLTEEDKADGAMVRSGLVPGFGNVGWRLKVGEIGVAPFDETASPFGWHIIKRLK